MKTMATTAKREWTAKLPKGAVSIVLMHRPVGADECLIHAWDALAALARGESPADNRAYAMRRLAEADGYLATYPDRKIKFRAVFMRELAELRAAVAAVST